MKLDAIAAEWVSQDEKLLGQARKGRLTAFMDHLTPELVERWRAEAEAPSCSS
jgi:hypothetical protein